MLNKNSTIRLQWHDRTQGIFAFSDERLAKIKRKVNSAFGKNETPLQSCLHLHFQCQQGRPANQTLQEMHFEIQ